MLSFNVEQVVNTNKISIIIDEERERVREREIEGVEEMTDRRLLNIFLFVCLFVGFAIDKNFLLWKKNLCFQLWREKYVMLLCVCVCAQLVP